MIAAIDPVVPASPTPLTPSGFVVAGALWFASALVIQCSYASAMGLTRYSATTAVASISIFAAFSTSPVTCTTAMAG